VGETVGFIVGASVGLIDGFIDGFIDGLIEGTIVVDAIVVGAYDIVTDGTTVGNVLLLDEISAIGISDMEEDGLYDGP